MAGGRFHRRQPAVLGRQAAEARSRRRDGRNTVSASMTAACPPRPTSFATGSPKRGTALQAGRAKRVGLVATNSIRGGANRKVLEPIAERNAIFEAWSDEPWTVDGAAVRVSLVCFGIGDTRAPKLDGATVETIHADLSAERSKLRAGAPVSARTPMSLSWATPRAARSTSKAHCARHGSASRLNANAQSE